jgi:hypothetical protein
VGSVERKMKFDNSSVQIIRKCNLNGGISKLFFFCSSSTSPLGEMEQGSEQEDRAGEHINHQLSQAHAHPGRGMRRSRATQAASTGGRV